MMGVTLLLIGAFAMSLSPLAAMAVDLAGRHLSGTASGVLDAHGYFYAGLQAIVFGLLLNMSGRQLALDLSDYGGPARAVRHFNFVRQSVRRDAEKKRRRGTLIK